MLRAVLTIATGKKIYLEMAINLANSFAFWNQKNDIVLYILTDIDSDLPKSFGRKVRVIKFSPGELGVGFASKLSIDRYLPADVNLFIDADCLCTRSLDDVFSRFSGKTVSVVGGSICSGEWSGSVLKMCELAGVAKIPKFNGGLYYVANIDQARRVYEKARAMVPLYDEMGLVRLRGLPNEEPLMAMAMAQEDCWGIHDDGSVLGDFQAASKVNYLNCILGRCELENPPAPDPRNKPWYSVRFSRPAIVHFLGHHVESSLYKREVLRFKLAFRYHIPVRLAGLIGTIYHFPYAVLERGKNMVRPAYRALFGVRAIRKSRR